MKRELLITFDSDADTRILIEAKETEEPFNDLMVLIETVAAMVKILKGTGVIDIDGRPVETWVHNQLNKCLAILGVKTINIVKADLEKMN